MKLKKKVLGCTFEKLIEKNNKIVLNLPPYMPIYLVEKSAYGGVLYEDIKSNEYSKRLTDLWKIC